MLQKIILFISATLLLSACSSNFGLMKRRYTKGYYVSSARHHQAEKHAVETRKAQAKQQPEEVETIVVSSPAEILNQAPVAARKQAIASPAASSKKAARAAIATIKKEKKADAASTLQLMQKPDSYRAVKQEKNLEKASDADTKLIIMVILSLFPFINLIAIYMHDNDITLNFWITLLLDFTFIGGIIFSLLVVLDIVDLRK
jgi:hypothetical protein